MSTSHEELSKKIKAAKEEHDQELSGKIYGYNSSDASALGKALRVGTEIVSAILVGLLLGYWVDKIFNIAPFGMVFMVFLGFIASILNIYRLEQDLLDRRSSPINEDKDIRDE